jgi:hypothetical protein
MKTIVLGALLLASFFTASAQQVPSAPSKMRYGVYFDFGWTPTLNIGGAASYSLVKWANLRAEAGVLFLLGTVTTWRAARVLFMTTTGQPCTPHTCP